MNINSCVLLAYLLLLIFSTFFKKGWLPYLLIVYGCTSTFLYEFVFMLTPFKLFILWFPVLLLFLGLNRKNKDSFSPFIFLFVSIAVTFLINIYDVSQIDVSDGQIGNLRPWVRSLFNSLLYIGSLLLIPIISSVINSYSFIVNLIRFYLFVTTVLCAYGAYQVAAYYLHFPLRPIWYGNSPEDVGVPTFSLMGMLVLRMYSLCSEPKILASVLLPAGFLFALPKEYLNILNLKPFTSRLLCVVHFAVIIGTFSTSTFFSLVACAIYFCFLFLLRSKKFILGATVFLFFMMLAYFGFVKGSQLEVVAQKTYELRVSDKVSKEEIVEKKILNFMYKNPQHLLIGVGAGNILYFLRNESGRIYEFSNAGVLILATEFGLIGLLAWAWFFLGVIRSNIAGSYPPNPYQKLEFILKMIFVISFISYVFRDNIFLIVFTAVLLFAFRRVHLAYKEKTH